VQKPTFGDDYRLVRKNIHLYFYVMIRHRKVNIKKKKKLHVETEHIMVGSLTASSVRDSEVTFSGLPLEAAN